MGVLIAFLAAIMGLAVLLILFYKLWFLRDPERHPPKGNNIVSPADGRIIEIKEITQAGKQKVRKGIGEIETESKKGCMITVFMTPFNVHYQRAPYDGKVIDIKYTKGKFLTAEKPRPENENNQIMISTKIGAIKVIQIAGFMARRIVCFAKKNQNIKKGQKIGLIKIGSQICLFMPKTKKIRLLVKIGDKVKAGETVIAELG